MECENVTKIFLSYSVSSFIFYFRFENYRLRKPRQQLKSHCILYFIDFIYLSIYLWLYSLLLDLGRFLSFLILYTIGRIHWTGDQPVARPLLTEQHKQNKRKETCMPWVGFEPTIPAFERAKTVYAWDCAVTVIGDWSYPYKGKVVPVLN
jgi:hypothetical protein